MKYFQRISFSLPLIVVSALLQAVGALAPTNVSSLATAKGYLIAGTFNGEAFISLDSGHHWSDVSHGLCDSSSLRYQKMIKCFKVVGDDSIHAITACGEFASAVPDVHWEQISSDSCQVEYCPACMPDLNYTASLIRWIITAGTEGLIKWSQDSGKTWTIVDSGCQVCSMPIIQSLYFDTISAFIGFYSGYGTMIGYTTGIIMSIDSGRTWHETGFPPVTQGVRSIVRMGSIVFAGTDDGIFASRDNFTTWWLLGGMSSVKEHVLPQHDKTVENGGCVREFTLTGKSLLRTGRMRGNQVMIEIRPDVNRPSVAKTVTKLK